MENIGDPLTQEEMKDIDESIKIFMSNFQDDDDYMIVLESLFKNLIGD
jgi:hypothetical protein